MHIHLFSLTLQQVQRQTDKQPNVTSRTVYPPWRKKRKADPEQGTLAERELVY